MAWENRNGRNYYYNKAKRSDGRVESRYVGCGELAELVAQEDADRRAADHIAKALLQAEKAEQDEIDRRLDQSTLLVEALMQATLRDAGLHYHRGEWRRRRDE